MRSESNSECQLLGLLQADHRKLTFHTNFWQKRKKNQHHNKQQTFLPLKGQILWCSESTTALVCTHRACKAFSYRDACAHTYTSCLAHFVLSPDSTTGSAVTLPVRFSSNALCTVKAIESSMTFRKCNYLAESSLYWTSEHRLMLC